ARRALSAACLTCTRSSKRLFGRGLPVRMCVGSTPMPAALRRSCRPQTRKAGAAFSRPWHSQRSFLWQGISDHGVADGRFHEVMPARRDDDILAAIDLIADRRCLPATGQNIRPDCFPRLDINGVDEII